MDKELKIIDKTQLILKVVTGVISGLMVIYGFLFKSSFSEVVDTVPNNIIRLNNVLLLMGFLYIISLIIYEILKQFQNKKPENNDCEQTGLKNNTDNEDSENVPDNYVAANSTTCKTIYYKRLTKGWAIFYLILAALAFLSTIYYTKYDETFMHITLNKTFGQYDKDEKNTNIVNVIQKKFKCCGMNGLDYWTNEIPRSCDEFGDTSHYYNFSCESKMLSHLHFIQKKFLILICLFAVLLVLLGCSLLYTSSKHHTHQL